jgi:iron complex outermembrane receptor protein
LNQLKQQPEGVSRSVIPRSEMSDQPVRTLKESMESVPGVAVSPGAGGRTVDLSIRGSGK